MCTKFGVYNSGRFLEDKTPTDATGHCTPTSATAGLNNNWLLRWMPIVAVQLQQQQQQ